MINFYLFQNIMKMTDGLFLSVAAEVAKDYPHIKFNGDNISAYYINGFLSPNFCIFFLFHTDMIIDNW